MHKLVLSAASFNKGKGTSLNLSQELQCQMIFWRHLSRMPIMTLLTSSLVCWSPPSAILDLLIHTLMSPACPQGVNKVETIIKQSIFVIVWHITSTTCSQKHRMLLSKRFDNYINVHLLTTRYFFSCGFSTSQTCTCVFVDAFSTWVNLYILLRILHKINLVGQTTKSCTWFGARLTKRSMNSGWTFFTYSSSISLRLFNYKVQKTSSQYNSLSKFRKPYTVHTFGNKERFWKNRIRNDICHHYRKEYEP
jgi:hypothetical protein